MTTPHESPRVSGAIVRVGTRVLGIALGPAILITLLSPAAGEIWEDACAWERPLGPRALGSRHGRFMWLSYLFAKHREFRTLAYYRLSQHGPVWALAVVGLRILYPPQVALNIDCPHVGPRLFIEHGFATTVTAAKIGADCWINQNVTIGFSSRPGLPELGDRVYIRAGAVVVGPVSVGEGSHVGANSVVTKDVPPWTLVAGVPAREIRRMPRQE